MKVHSEHSSSYCCCGVSSSSIPPRALSFGLSETIVYRDLQIVLFLLSHKQSEAPEIHHPSVRLFCIHKGAINFCKVSPLRRHRTLYCPIQYEILCGGFEYKKCTRKSATGGGREEGRAGGPVRADTRLFNCNDGHFFGWSSSPFYGELT